MKNVILDGDKIETNFWARVREKTVTEPFDQFKESVMKTMAQAMIAHVKGEDKWQRENSRLMDSRLQLPLQTNQN